MNGPTRIVSVLSISLLMLAATLALVSALASAAPRAAGPVCTVGGATPDHTTIAGAVGDTNCVTITVAAGTYYENLTIDRDLAIVGAGATSTIVDGNGSVTNQRVMTITADREVAMSGVTIQNGHAISGAYGGGGIANRGYLTLTQVILTNNTVTGTNDEDVGGAISPGGFGDKGLVLADCIVSHNSAPAGGGVFYNGPTEMSNTLFYSNTAAYAGGWYNYGPATLVNVTFSGNHSSGNGAAIRTQVEATLINCTVADNAGGYAIQNAATITMANTLLARNGVGNCTSSIASGGYNLEDSDDCGLAASTDITETSPLLGPLKDNGGFSWTHALGSGSRGIDEAGASFCPATDQRGWERPFDGDGDSIALCDIGAFEYYPGVYLPLVLRDY